MHRAGCYYPAISIAGVISLRSRFPKWDEVIKRRVDRRFLVSTAAQLASVSEPTVVRFCRSLGCAGNPDSKLKLAQSLASNQPYLHQEIAPGDTSDEVANKITALSVKKLSEVSLTLTRGCCSERCPDVYPWDAPLPSLSAAALGPDRSGKR